MSQPELLPLLRRNPHFARLAPDDLDALASAFFVEHFSEGHVLTRQGEQGGTVYLLLDGECIVSTEHDGVRRELNRLHPGDLIGLVSLVDNQPRSATCTTAVACNVASLPPGATALLFHARAAIGCAFQLALATQLARDFRHLDAQLRTLYSTQNT